MKNIPKFTAIAVAVDSDGAESLYALGEDGFIYCKCGRRTSAPGEKPVTWVEYWDRLDIPFGDPSNRARTEGDDYTTASAVIAGR